MTSLYVLYFMNSAYFQIFILYQFFLVKTFLPQRHEFRVWCQCLELPVETFIDLFLLF